MGLRVRLAYAASFGEPRPTSGRGLDDHPCRTCLSRDETARLVRMGLRVRLAYAASFGEPRPTREEGSMQIRVGRACRGTRRRV
jgi:hypothetical protein